MRRSLEWLALFSWLELLGLAAFVVVGLVVLISRA